MWPDLMVQSVHLRFALVSPVYDVLLTLWKQERKNRHAICHLNGFALLGRKIHSSQFLFVYYKFINSEL